MKMRINVPIDEMTLKKLSVGNQVLISGILFTSRDRAHEWLVSEKLSKIPREIVTGLKNGAVYHCGPVAEQLPSKQQRIKKWKIISAGPTTSKRMEAYMPQLISRFGIRAIIGKGGMLSETHKALVKNGCVYVSVVGGAAALLASKIVSVKNVWKLEFGIPEAIWQLEVRDMPGVVTMDTSGRCLHDEIFRDAKKRSGLY